MTQQPWHPGTLLEMSGYFWKTCTLHAAVKLDVFTLIGEKRLGAEEIAAKAGGDIDAAARLLDALVGMALLCKENGRAYSEAEIADMLKSAGFRESPAWTIPAPPSPV